MTSRLQWFLEKPVVHGIFAPVLAGLPMPLALYLLPLLALSSIRSDTESAEPAGYDVSAEPRECYSMRIVEGDRVVHVVREGAPLYNEEKQAVLKAIEMIAAWEKNGLTGEIETNTYSYGSFLSSPVFRQFKRDWDKAKKKESDKEVIFPTFAASEVLKRMFEKNRICAFSATRTDLGASASRPSTHGHSAQGIDDYRGAGTIEIRGHPGIDVWVHILPRRYHGEFREEDVLQLAFTLFHEVHHIVAPEENIDERDPGRLELGPYRFQNLCMKALYDYKLNEFRHASNRRIRKGTQSLDAQRQQDRFLSRIRVLVSGNNEKLRKLCAARTDDQGKPFPCGCRDDSVSDCDYCGSQIDLKHPLKDGAFGNVQIRNGRVDAIYRCLRHP